MENEKKVKLNLFRQWLRQWGIQILFIIALFLSWKVYNNLFLSPVLTELSLLETCLQELGFYQLSNDVIEKYGIFPTCWLFAIRMQALFAFHVISKQARAFLLSRPQELDAADFHSTSHTNPGRQQVHCLCIRIVTRGDEGARPLLIKAVTRAITLFNVMCECEHLQAHVVTQKQFLDKPTKQLWLRLGATEVKEFVVPANYITPKGTLYKARNFCYWQMMGGIGSECDETNSWILSLDEEAIISRSVVSSFIDDVLNHRDVHKIGYALSSAIIDVRPGDQIPLINKLMEARTVACHYAYLTRQMADVVGHCFHGGAFFVRANIESDVGNDWGPPASVAEDFATGLVATEKNIGVKVLNGWFLEGAALNVFGYITQRARYLRGQIYATYYVPISRKQTFLQICRLSLGIVYPFLHMVAIALLILVPSAFMPAGPRCSLLDMLFIFSLNVQMSAFVFGAAYMNMSLGEMIASILLSPFMAIFGAAPFIEALANVKGFYDMYTDWKTGNISFAVTQKAEAQPDFINAHNE